MLYRISSDSTKNILRHINASILSEKFQIRFLVIFSIGSYPSGVRLYNSCNKKALIKVSISVKTSLSVKQTSCCLKNVFLLDILNSVNCIFSLTGQKICPLASIPREALFFNIDSMTYRIRHTANDKTLSFSANILKLHSKKWSIREISLSLKDIFAELHRPHENLRKNE